MRNVLAEGHKWIMTLETNPQTLDRFYLQLVSKFGTVEIVSYSPDVLRLFEKIEQEYNKLREQGPIEQASCDDGV